MAKRLVSGPYVWYGLGLVLTLAIWQTMANVLGPYRLPNPSAVASQLTPLLTRSEVLSFQGGGSRGYWPHLVHTVIFTIMSSAIGISAGVLFGLAMIRYRLIKLIAEVPIELLRTIPPLAAVPFVLIWIGPGDTAQVLMVGYYTFVVMVITTLTAAMNVDPILPTFAATLGAQDGRIFRTVVFPAMLPGIVGGIRVSVGIAWSVQIVAELVGGKYGMGRVFSAMIAFQALDAIIVGIIWIAFVAAVADAFVVIGIRRFTRWVPAESR